MKQNLFLWFMLLGTLSLSAQSTDILPLNEKIGKPTAEELTMTTYAPDSSAAAVVLYKETSVDYKWGVNDFQLISYHKRRVKVLKEEGTSYANFTIPYYERKDNKIRKEVILDVDAYAYNLEDGKTVRTKMKREQMFKERIDDAYMQLKFTVPQVKVGTVIEVEYRIVSDLYYYIRDWVAHEEIPVAYAKYEVVLPEYFRFNVEYHGMEMLEAEEIPDNKSFLIEGQLLQCTAARKRFTGKQLSAMKKDNFVWCADNYYAQVNMELEGYQFPGSIVKTFTQTWEEIEKLLLEDSDFGGRLRMSNPLKEEMATLNLAQIGSTEEKICAIYALLKQKVKWDGRYSLFGKSGRQTVKEGSGSNADINFILISMLKDAGINAYPIIMSRRDQRQLHFSHPTLQKLNTFVIGIAMNDSALAYLDASVNDGYINVLPTVLLTNRARLLTGNGGQWLNLQNISKSYIRRTVQATLNPDGQISGNRITTYQGQNAADLRKAYRLAKDSTDFIKQLASESDMEIEAYSAQNLHHFSPIIREGITFKKKAESSGEHIYINPLLFIPTKESPFKQSERKLPIEFAHTDMLNQTISLILPEGYVVDEIPESGKMTTTDGKISFSYHIQQQGNRINLRYTFQLNQLFYARENYPELKKFWELMAEKNNAILVLKKQP